MTTGVDCIGFGNTEVNNFQPLGSGQIFFGTRNPAQNLYYFVKINFSAPGSPIWQRQISPGTLATGGTSLVSSLLSSDGAYIYSSVTIGSDLIFLKINANTADLGTDGGFVLTSYYGVTAYMSQSSEYVIVIHQKRSDNQYHVYVIEKTTWTLTTILDGTDDIIFNTYPIVISGTEIIYFMGISKSTSPNRSYLGKVRADSFLDLESQSVISATPVALSSSSYTYSTVSVSLAISTSNQPVTINTTTFTTALDPQDVLSSLSQDYGYQLVLNNQDFNETFTTDELVTLNFKYP